jgi:hypothetical protein
VLGTINRRAIIVVCLLAILVVAVVVVVAYTISSSRQLSTVLSVEPKTVHGAIGQNFTVNVSISSVSDLYGWEFKLGWNASLLDLVSVNEGPFLRSGGNTLFTYFLNTTEEHIVVDCTLEGPIPGVNGSGTLATVTFNPTNAGECPLNLYGVGLYNSSEPTQPIPSQAVSGYGYFR